MALPRTAVLTRALAGAAVLVLAGDGLAVAAHRSPTPVAVRTLAPAPAPADDPDTTAVPPPTTGSTVAVTVPAAVARRPRLPTVTLPPVTVPPLPVPAVPTVIDPCTALAGPVAAAGPLQDTGMYTAAVDGSGLVRVAPSDEPGAWSGDDSRIAFRVPQAPGSSFDSLCVRDRVGGACTWST